MDTDGLELNYECRLFVIEFIGWMDPCLRDCRVQDSFDLDARRTEVDQEAYRQRAGFEIVHALCHVNFIQLRTAFTSTSTASLTRISAKYSPTI